MVSAVLPEGRQHGLGAHFTNFWLPEAWAGRIRDEADMDHFGVARAGEMRCFGLLRRTPGPRFGRPFHLTDQQALPVHRARNDVHLGLVPPPVALRGFPGAERTER